MARRGREIRGKKITMNGGCDVKAMSNRIANAVTWKIYDLGCRKTSTLVFDIYIGCWTVVT